MHPAVTGIVLLLIGVGLFAAVYTALKGARRQPAALPDLPNSPPIPPGLTEENKAILLVKVGGRVVYINKEAREWFGLLEEEPNLERLARRARPSNTFLSLCAGEGQARFSMNGIFVEGSSAYLPYEDSGAVLVTLHRPQVAPLEGEGPTRQAAGQTVDIFAELSQSMAASLDLKTTLQAVLESVERLIPSDFPEITLWDADNNILVPYRFTGLQGVDRRLEKSTDRYQPGEGYSGFLATKRQPLLIGDVDSFRHVRPAVERKQYPFNSYVGIPMLLAGELVGTLELASLVKNAFSQSDLEVLRILSGQAAVAVHNALLYEAEQRRVLELSGLAQLAHAAGSLYKPEDLYTRLVEILTPLVEAEILGFWIYDDLGKVLEAKLPFAGIPPQFLSAYSKALTSGGELEEILQKPATIVTSNASEDEAIRKLGLDMVMVAAGIREMVMAPLTSGGKMLGYLLVANKPDRTAFDRDDLNMLEIITGQVAIIIENSTLAQQTSRRAQRAEALRRIASLTASAATLDEILYFSVIELARLSGAAAAGVYLLNETTGDLHLHPGSLYGINPEQVSNPALTTIKHGQSYMAGTGKLSYITSHAALDPQLLPAYLPLLEALELQSAMFIPLVVRERGLGELLLASPVQNFFDRSDIIMIDTAAGQMASAIERSNLYGQTDDTLRQRVDQLSALARINRELNTRPDLPQLLREILEEAILSTRAECGAIVLAHQPADDQNAWEITFHAGDAYPAGLTPLEEQVLSEGRPQIIADYADLSGENNRRPHGGAVSALIAPIATGNEIHGLLSLHARTPSAFDEIEKDVAQALAIQAAIAICNESRYHQQIERSELLKRRAETLANLIQTTQTLQIDQPLEGALQAVAQGIQESTAFEVVLISLYNPLTSCLERVASAGLSAEQMETARSHKQPWEAVQKFLLPEFQSGAVYFVPADRSPQVPQEIEFVYPTQRFEPSENGRSWNADDMCLMPLVRQDGAPLGLISVDVPKDGLRPDATALDSLEIFASQAGLFIESRLKLHELTARASMLQGEVERMEIAGQQTRKQIPALLHKDLEQTLAIKGLSQRTRRLRAALDIGESLNRQPDEAAVLNSLGSEIITRMDFDLALVALPGAAGPRLEAVLGQAPAGVHPDALLGQKNPLRHSLQTGELLLVSNLMESPEWQGSPLLQSLEAKAFICLPVLADESPQAGRDTPTSKIEAALLGVCMSPLPAFTPEDSQVYTLLSRQAGIALQNLRLLNETNRRLQEVDLLLEFSRQLGSLDPARILNILVESTLKVIPNAHAGMVALWDEKAGLLIPQVAAGYRKNEAMLEIRFKPGEALPGQALIKGEALHLDEVDFARHYNLPSEGLLNYRNATGGLLPISTLVAPLGARRALPGGELAYPLGVIVLDNFKITSAFSAEDLALVTSLTQQTALTLENARLYQASELRARQMQALTQVAASITSSLQSSELIPSLLDQVASILPYDTGTLWLRRGDRLNIQAARGFEDSEERVGLSVALEDSLLLQEMINTGQPISVSDVREDIRFPSLMEARYLSWLGVPLISKGQVVGVIALEKTEAGYYSGEYIQAVTTFAGQAAVALENAGLYEESVQRAQELDQRSERLALLNRLSTSLSGSFDLHNILGITVAELQQALGCSAVSAAILPGENEARLEAEIPTGAEAAPRPLPYAPIFDHLKETLGIYSAEDIWSGSGEERQLPPLLAPLAAYLATQGTRGLLITPLITGTDLHGLLLIHNQAPYRFSAEEVELARTIANQAAIAVQNARLFAETERLFAETRQQSGELAGLFNFGMNISRVLDRKQLIDLSFENVINMIKADSVMLALKGERDELVIQGIEHGKPVGPVALSQEGESLSQWVLNSGQPLLLQDLQADLTSLPVPGVTMGDPTRSWMGVPLAVRGTNIGVISVQSDSPGQFGQEHLRLIGQVGNQLATALDNARLFTTVQNHAAVLEQRVAERTEQLGLEHKRTQTLLGIITELSNSLEMDLVLNRTLGLINETIGSDHSLIVLVDQDMPRLFLRAALDAEGNFTKGSASMPMKMDEGIAGWVVSKREPVMAADLHTESRWENLEGYARPYHSVIAVPLMMGEDVLGTLLLFHGQPGKFDNDQFELVEATAKQIAVAINNAQLFNLIRDQAERLGDMLRTQHIETSRSQAILEAVADGVLVTDANRVISVFNASAEHILGLRRADVIGQSLEHFSGLFGNAAQTWMETIHAWSENPAERLSSRERGVYSEQLETEDGRVVSVHLAPVHLRNDFLGTVSIFEDITHQVEVDRLKTEFVATVSHELRTPMTSIKGYVEILLMGAAGQLSEQQTHFLEIVKANTERLAILVNDLLDISRIEAGKVTLTLQPVDLLELARKAAGDLIRRTQEEQKPMDIQLALPPFAPPVCGDPERVRQMLDNLLENAYYYTPENGRIILTVCPAGDEVQVDVQDNGIGILPRDQDRIFERFFRGEDPLVLATSGTGLGLSIVRRLIDMHNGRIWFSSKGVPGEGSLFSFTLPIYEAGG